MFIFNLPKEIFNVLKKIKSDYITSELNKFKSDYDKEFNKKRLIKQRKLKCLACDFEEKRRQYCRQVYDLYYGALKKNDIETLRDRQSRLLHSTEISNNIFIGVGGSLAVSQILILLDELFKEPVINPIAKIIIVFIGIAILIILVMWLFCNLFHEMIEGYKRENMFGTVSWEIKFLEEKLIDKTQEAIKAVRLENTVDDENSETTTDNKEDVAEILNEQDDNVRI